MRYRSRSGIATKRASSNRSTTGVRTGMRGVGTEVREVRIENGRRSIRGVGTGVQEAE